MRASSSARAAAASAARTRAASASFAARMRRASSPTAWARKSCPQRQPRSAPSWWRSPHFGQKVTTKGSACMPWQRGHTNSGSSFLSRKSWPKMTNGLTPPGPMVAPTPPISSPSLRLRSASRW